MSAGHRHDHPDQAHRAELAHIRAQPWFAEWWAKPFTVNAEFDIPYLGGSSMGGDRVYVDRNAYPLIVKEGLLSGLITHERVEGILLRTGRSYAGAHELATEAENETYRRGGRDPQAAQKLYPKLLDMAATAPIFMVPDDLRMEPYLYPPVDEVMLARMRAAMAPVAKAA